jgi:DNA ligase (NAD+)
MNADIASLVERLTKARDAYYNGVPIMPDAAYDALEDELRQYDPNHAFLKKVGAAAPVAGAWPKVHHTIPMSSLNKAQDNGGLKAWFASCAPVGDTVVMDKLDGCSIALRYENRRLVQALTRGDGTTGEDITRNVLLMQGAVKVLPGNMPMTVHVRGEIICKKSDFKAHFPGESNPRNTASGTAKRQSDPAKCAHLTVVAYQLLVPGASQRKRNELAALRDMGFQVPRFAVVRGEPAVEALYQQYIKGVRASLDYDIDGLVVEIDNVGHRDTLGELNGRPKGATAYKFPHEMKPTVLKNVRWQVGNSGRITPVAEFDVANLAGANVVQASLHNISNIEAVCQEQHGNRLHVGDKILVSRRNDCIPYVEALLVPNLKGIALEVPTHCPECKTALQRDGEYLICPNTDGCEAQRSGAIKRWVDKISVLHVGDTLIEALVESGKVKDIADLYTLDPAAVAAMTMSGRSVGESGTKAIRNLRAKMTLPLHLIIGSLGIPNVGRTTAKTIVDAGLNSVDKMLKASYTDVAGIPGVGASKAEDFVDGMKAKAKLLSKLFNAGIQVQQVGGALAGKSFCMTGFRDKTLEEAIEAQGGSIKSSVGKGLTYLIALDPNSGSGKVEKAKQYGTKIIGVEQTRDLIAGK